MAGNQELRRLFADFLLGAEVSDCYTLDEFREFFPVKFRDHSDVKILYDAFQLKRKKIRQSVKRNIRRHCSSSTPLDNTEDKTSSDVEDNVAELEEKEEMLRKELSLIEEETKTVREQLQSCLESLEDVEWFHSLHKKDFDLNQVQELSEQLGINIS